jgi:hypothetical protein
MAMKYPRNGGLKVAILGRQMALLETSVRALENHMIVATACSRDNDFFSAFHDQGPML